MCRNICPLLYPKNTDSKCNSVIGWWKLSSVESYPTDYIQLPRGEKKSLIISNNQSLISVMGTIACIVSTSTATPATARIVGDFEAKISRSSLFYLSSRSSRRSISFISLSTNPNFTTKTTFSSSSSMAFPLQVHASSSIGLYFTLWFCMCILCCASSKCASN